MLASRETPLHGWRTDPIVPTARISSPLYDPSPMEVEEGRFVGCSVGTEDKPAGGRAHTLTKQLEGAFPPGVDEDHLEGGTMPPQSQLPVHPFDLLAGVVFRIGEEAVQLSYFRGFDQAVAAPGLALLEIGADQIRKVFETGRIGRRRPVSQVFALMPIGQQVGVTDPGGAPPAFPGGPDRSPSRGGSGRAGTRGS